MISCKLAGGLGNQLFQIFTTIAYALKYSKPFFFLNNQQLGDGSNGITIRYTYWETFLSSLKPFLKNIDSIPQLMFIRETNFNYNKLPEIFEKNISSLLVGYFQSPKYFNRYKETICKMLKLDFKKFILKNKIRVLTDVLHSNNIIISMHFRIGDYKKYPHIYPILSKQYYHNSLLYIENEITLENTTVIYICENEDVTEVEYIIQRLKIQFPLINFERANPLLDDWEQLLLMSLCHHNIIANSTFSWWGAYLNDNLENNIVCYPEQWFMPESNKDVSDLFLEYWKPISF